MPSYTLELDRSRAELHGLMSMMAGAGEIISYARVKAYCGNHSVVSACEKVSKAIGHEGFEWRRNSATWFIFSKK